MTVISPNPLPCECQKCVMERIREALKGRGRRKKR